MGFAHRTGADPQGTLIAGYGWSFDRANRLTGMDFLPDGTTGPFDYTAEGVTFTYDARGQSTDANRSGAGQDEDYVYDSNGNRVSAGEPSWPVPYTTGPNNQVLSDGTYTYTYDAEGNRSPARTRSGPIPC